MIEREKATWPVDCGEQQSRNEGKVVHEEAELRLVVGPTPRSVEGKAKEQNIRGRKERGLRKICAGEKAQDQNAFEQGGAPSQQQWNWQSRRSNVARRAAHIRELERRSHDEDTGKNQPPDKDRYGFPRGLKGFRGHESFSELRSTGQTRFRSSVCRQPRRYGEAPLDPRTIDQTESRHSAKVFSGGGIVGLERRPANLGKLRSTILWARWRPYSVLKIAFDRHWQA
jgi:hypothetical protein